CTILRVGLRVRRLRAGTVRACGAIADRARISAGPALVRVLYRAIDLLDSDTAVGGGRAWAALRGGRHAIAGGAGRSDAARLAARTRPAARCARFAREGS